MGLSYKPLFRILFEKEMTKGKLCNLTGIAPSTVSKMSNGEYVSLEVLEKICKLFDCQISDLVEVVSEKEDKKEE